jgi:two-component system, NtrC family, response regulator HydG
MARFLNAQAQLTPAILSDAASGTFKVLVVDDESATAQTVGNMLVALGAQVDLANGGEEAQSLARIHKYALVITDYKMPGLDGFGLALWIKKRRQDTLVFVMTGCNPAEVADYANGDVVDRWLYKPFNLAQLREALAGAALLSA